MRKLREVLQGFEEQNPGIKVTVTTAVSDNKLMTALAAGAGPDLATMHGGVYSLLGKNGLLRPIDPLPKSSGGFQVKDLARGFEMLGVYDGVRYALPFWDIAPSYATVYNALYFDEAGIPRPSYGKAPLWTDITAWNKKLTRTTADGTLVRMGFHPNEGWHSRSYTIETLFDAQLYTDGYKPNLSGNRNLFEGISTLKELFLDPYPGALSFKPNIATGNTAMLINGSQLVTNRLQKQISMPVDATWAPHVKGQLTQRWRARALEFRRTPTK